MTRRDMTSAAVRIGASGLRSSCASIARNSANAGGAGRIVSGALEASNVDLAAEFTNLITTQRAYSAASRIITTADEMLEELLMIKR
jgi:flagellar hook protein FlgE